MNDFDLLALFLAGASWQAKALVGAALASLAFGPALYLGGWLLDLFRSRAA
jgi:hypothetical protein